MKPRIIAALACVLGSLLVARPAMADPTYDKCIDRTSTNPEWGRCGSAYLQRLDAALNAAWKRAVSTLSSGDRATLLGEQRAWIRFKDSSCQIYANGSFGREGQVLHFYQCRAAIIEHRIADLNGLSQLGH